MSGILIFAYGIACYVIFFATFLYSIGFLGNLLVPKGIDTGQAGAPVAAVIVDVLLLGGFAVQHSVMARPAFKKWWTGFVPAAMERSTYVLFSSLVLILLFWLWQPIPGVVWAASGAAAVVLWGLFAFGWVVVLLSTLMIGHFELFGLLQVYQHLRALKPREPGFITPGFYALVRHPIMTGFVIAFWAIPVMTWGHLLFAVVTTLYILAALPLEERDLIPVFGERYREYRRQVPMLIPLPRRLRRGKTQAKE